MKIPFRISLLGWVAIAIVGGILLGQFLPTAIVRIFVTFNSLFGNFLSFAIPLIILGLVAPAIGELGKGAGRLLLITALIAYGSTIFSGFFTYFTGVAVFPHSPLAPSRSRRCRTPNRPCSRPTLPLPCRP